MTPDGSLTLFHAPRSRSTGVVILLEELGVPYRLRVLDPSAQGEVAAYRAIEPLGRVPALLHQGQLVSEPVAVGLYLADWYADRGLAPALREPLRGPYLRWMAWLAGPGSSASAGSPEQRDLWGALDEALRRGPYLLGERYSAADVLWAAALDPLDLTLPERVRSFVTRIHERPAAQRVRARDEVWSADLAAGREVVTP